MSMTLFNVLENALFHDSLKRGKELKSLQFPKKPNKLLID